MTNLDHEKDEEENLIYFVDDFIAELDSWFSADIKCCDECYDDFVRNWPIISERGKHFYSIDVGTFYDGSRLRDMYTKKQFLENVHLVKCPRCGSSIKYNFWPFEFEFDDYDSLEVDFESLKDDIRETPFIVLKNPIADRTFNFIEKQFLKREKTKLDFPLFRGRVINHTGIEKKDFLPPPKEYTNEGRYNHLGIPVIYVANKEITCFNELRQPNENLFIAEIFINKELQLLDLNNIEDDKNEGDLLKAIVLSSIASSRADDNAKYKPEYYFTRFISDCCKYLGFEGIIYPSVQVGVGENFVLFDTNVIDESNIRQFKLYNHKTDPNNSPNWA